VVQDRAPVRLDLAAPWCDYPRCMASENVASAEVQNAHGAVASVQEAPPPNEPAMLTRGLDHVAKVIAIASVAVFGTGFIVAGPLVQQVRCSTAALTHEVVLGAGVQFMLVCMSCLAPLVALRLGVFGKPTSSPTKAMDSAKGRMRRTVVAVRQVPGVLFGGVSSADRPVIWRAPANWLRIPRVGLPCSSRDLSIRGPLLEDLDQRQT